MAVNGVGSSFYGGILKQGSGTGVTQAQQKVLSSIEDPEERARMSAQFALQRHTEMIAFISNVMKMQHEAAMSIINNCR